MKQRTGDDDGETDEEEQAYVPSSKLIKMDTLKSVEADRARARKLTRKEGQENEEACQKFVVLALNPDNIYTDEGLLLRLHLCGLYAYSTMPGQA